TLRPNLPTPFKLSNSLIFKEFSARSAPEVGRIIGRWILPSRVIFSQPQFSPIYCCSACTVAQAGFSSRACRHATFCLRFRRSHHARSKPTDRSRCAPCSLGNALRLLYSRLWFVHLGTPGALCTRTHRDE